jgi:phosphatidylglycerol---prolipoprotein diacylglyceryl transferase
MPLRSTSRTLVSRQVAHNLEETAPAAISIISAASQKTCTTCYRLRQERRCMLLYFVWNVSPDIFQIGPFALRWYGVCFALGFFLGYLIMVQIYRHERKAEEHLSSLFLYIFLGTIIGARVGHVLFYQPDYYLTHPWAILMIWQGGLASHGGFAGVLIALYLYVRKYHDITFLELADRLVIAILPGAGLIRIGNFFNSEIIGVPTNGPWAVVFLRVDNLPRHPAMLYEAIFYLLVFAILYFGYWRTEIIKTPGRVLGVAFVACFTARFLIEFIKEDQVTFERYLPLNLGQLLSIPFVAIGFFLLRRASRKVIASNR